MLYLYALVVLFVYLYVEWLLIEYNFSQVRTVSKAAPPALSTGLIVRHSHCAHLHHFLNNSTAVNETTYKQILLCETFS